jgi:ABC-2 type transport system ATP-binding protein
VPHCWEAPGGRVQPVYFRPRLAISLVRNESAIAVRSLTRRFGSFTAVDRVSFDVRPGYLDLTVEENLSFFGGAYRLRGKRRRERIGTALEMAELGGRRNTLTGALPGGIRQRLALASALMHEPKVLFLDEPTAGVDPAARRGFWRVIRQLSGAGTTLFVTTHHLDEAEYCERVGLMVDGRLVALDTPAGLKREHVPGTHFAVRAPGTGLRLSERLTDHPQVLGVQPFGRQAHVRVTGPLSDPDTFRALLGDRGVTRATVEPIEPTLEDVFLQLVGESP